ncbi:hypothetical protein DFH11DRAFT_1540937 [Phellopilus nigrolimitatus]|nr:hypothetical protein DFH11DRAFT_1540937 [Phellopilus nigrolimitatus]
MSKTMRERSGWKYYNPRVQICLRAYLLQAWERVTSPSSPSFARRTHVENSGGGGDKDDDDGGGEESINGTSHTYESEGSGLWRLRDTHTTKAEAFVSSHLRQPYPNGLAPVCLSQPPYAIISIKEQMDMAAEDLKRITGQPSLLRGEYASAINADVLIQIVSWLPPPNLAYLSSTDAPLNVSHVCRAWRDITISNPILWSKFRLYGDADSEPALHNQEDSIDNTFHPRFEAAIEAWEVWLVRSGSSPLDIGIDVQWSLDDSERITKLLTMTLSHQKRWKHINIIFPDGGTFTMYDMPLLESLSIGVNAVREDGLSEDFDVCLDLSRSSRLKDLRINQVLCLRRQPPALGNLRHLTLCYGTYTLKTLWDVFVQTVRFTPQLQVIRVLGLPVSDVPDATEVILPLVREATFFLTELENSHALSRALDQLIMPSLEELDIDAYSEDTNAGPSSICACAKSLLLRSKCSLTTLRLSLSSYGDPGTDDTIYVLDLMSATPALKHLSLTVDELDDAFLRALTIIPGPAGFQPQNILFPGLESIRFIACKHRMSSEAFCQMVASRWRAGRALRKVLVFDIFMETASRETHDMIDAFVSEGLEFQAF